MTLEHLIDKLNKYAPKKEQDFAVNAIASLLSDPKIMVMPRSEDFWHNCARVLKLMGRPRIDAAIPFLFDWIKNMEKPGSEIIFNLLAELPKQNLAYYIEKNSIIALDQNDLVWFQNLSLLSRTKHLETDDFESIDIAKKLLK